MIHIHVSFKNTLYMQTYIDNTCNFFIYFFLLLKLEIKSFFFVNVRKVEPIVLDDSEDDIFKSGKNLFSMSSVIAF